MCHLHAADTSPAHHPPEQGPEEQEQPGRDTVNKILHLDVHLPSMGKEGTWLVEVSVRRCSILSLLLLIVRLSHQLYRPIISVFHALSKVSPRYSGER